VLTLTVTLDGFDWAARPQLSPQVVKELLTCRFVEEHRNVILVGRPSTGKTTVAKALGHAACARALSVYYASMAEVLRPCTPPAPTAPTAKCSAASRSPPS
jgi:DNA replication protein DnaC